MILPWLIPLLLALGGICVAVAQLGGPRGGGAPYPARPWAGAGLVVFLVAGILVIIAEVSA